MSKKKRKKRGAARKALFVIELLVLVILVGILFVYTQLNKKLGKLNYQNQEESNLNVLINEGVSDNQRLHGYTNVALFGIDRREADGGYGNSDTALIASINNDTKEIRLVSIYRDSYLRVDEDYQGNGIYDKFNSAYLRGGPEQAMSAINTNMDLDIEKYIAVDFSAMAKAVDGLGGLDIPMSYEEIEHMNNYCVETSEETGMDYTPIEKPDPAPADESQIIGTYHLNGVQVTAYCRIRQTLNADMGRTERQRKVLGYMAEAAKKSPAKVFDVLDDVLPMIATNFSKSEIISLGKNLFNYELAETGGFPADFVMGIELTKPVTGLDCVIPTTLETNVTYLHEFLFGEKGYQPTGTVLRRSDFILDKTGFGTDYIAKERKYLIPDRLYGEGYGNSTASGGTYEDSTESEDGTEYGETGYDETDGSGDIYTEDSYGDTGYEESGEGQDPYDEEGYGYDEGYTEY